MYLHIVTDSLTQFFTILKAANTVVFRTCEKPVGTMHSVSQKLQYVMHDLDKCGRFPYVV